MSTAGPSLFGPALLVLHLWKHLPIFPRTGSHIEIHTAEWAIIDETTLMQRSATTRRTNRWHPRSRGLDLPRQSQEPREDADFCLNPAATPFDPNRPLLGSQSEFIQDFYQWWDFCAFSWEGEDRSTKILTFFVDHRAPHLRYDVGREVHLFEDYHWEDHIKSTWRELIDIGSELEFHLVHPQPPLLRPLHAACVVSVQAPREDLQVSPLITVSEGQGNLDLLLPSLDFTLFGSAAPVQSLA